jgi:multicomponent Na+:H+ antiporter subunit A
LSAGPSILVNWLLLFPFIAAVVIAAFPRVLRFVPQHERESTQAAPAATAIAAIGLSLAACVAAAVVISRRGDATVDYLWTPDFFQFRLRLDPLGVYALLAVLTALLATAVWAWMDGIRDYIRWAAFVAMAGAFTGIILAADVVLLYMFWELSALALWAAVGPPPAAGRRYLTWSHAGGLCVLVAVLVVAIIAHDTHIYTAGSGLLVQRLSAVKWIGLLLLVGLAVRLALVPLHFWLPALCGPAFGRWNSAVLGIGIVVAGYAAVRLIFYILPAYAAAAVAWLPITLGLITVAYAGARALLSDDICRGTTHLLAAAGGQIAIGIGFGMQGQLSAVVGAMALLVPLALAVPLLAAGTGALVGQLKWSMGRGTSVAAPARGAAVAVAAWTLCGLPPLAGFWGQRAVAAAAWEAGGAAVLLAGLIAPALILGYGLKAVVVGFARAKPGSTTRTDENRLWWWVAALTAVSLILGIGPNLWFAHLVNLARALSGN